MKLGISTTLFNESIEIIEHTPGMVQFRTKEVVPFMGDFMGTVLNLTDIKDIATYENITCDDFFEVTPGNSVSNQEANELAFNLAAQRISRDMAAYVKELLGGEAVRLGYQPVEQLFETGTY